MAIKASQAVSENKLSENIGSIILGFVVVLILGGFLLNVFRGNRGEVGESGKTAEEEIQSLAKEQEYTVKPGDTLWKIAEDQTGSGYNWQAIAKANNLKETSQIEEGTKLIIPQITGAEEIVKGPTVTMAPTVTVLPTVTVAPTQAPTAEVTQTPAVQPAKGQYVVIKGDNLWNIAVAQYNDGYKWVEIAKANGLKNPNIIHAGNVLKLP